MNVSRSEMRAVVIDDKFYVVGGFSTTGQQLSSGEVYDPVADTWTPIAPAPRGLDHHMMAAYNGKLYVLKYADIYVYDPAANSWSSQPDNSGMTRGDGTAVTLGPFIYVIGGGPLPIQRWQPDTDVWETLAPLQTSRGHVHAVVLDGKIWVLAGRSGNSAFRTVEIYDPATNTFSPGPAMDSVRSGHAAEVVNGKIVVAGGEVPGPNRLARTAEVFDPATEQWSFLPDPTVTVHGVASASWNGRFYLLGGATVAYSATNTTRSFYLEIPGPVSIRPERPGARSGSGSRAMRMEGGSIVLDRDGKTADLRGRRLPVVLTTPRD